MNLLDLYEAIANLNDYLEKVLSQDDVNFDITFKNLSYDFQSVYLLEDKQEQDAKRKELIRALLHDHVADIVDHVTLHANEPWTPRNLIIDILSQHAYRPPEATLEIVSEEYVIEDKK